MKKILKWTVLVLLVLAGLVSVAGMLIVRWARANTLPWPERLPGVRLEPSRPVLRSEDVKEDNAYFYLRKLDSRVTPFGLDDEATEELRNFDSCGLRGTNYPAIEAFLTLPQPAIAWVERAAAMPHCQVETYRDPEAEYFGSTLLTTLRLLAFRAGKSAAEGAWQSAAEDIRRIFRASQHMSRGSGLAHYYTGMEGEMIACNRLRRITLESDPPEWWSKEMIGLLRTADEQAEPLAEAIRVGRLEMMRHIDRVYSNPAALFGDYAPPAAPVFNLLIRSPAPRLLGGGMSRTLSNFDALWSHIVDIFEKPYEGSRYESEVAAFIRPAAPGAIFAACDPVGRFIALLSLSGYDRFQRRALQLAASRRGTAVFLAVCRYRRDHGGALPATLGDLVPRYIAGVPTDPFSPTGEPLRWSRTDARWCVYSIGSDQDDDGGVTDPAVRYMSEWSDGMDVCLASDQFEQLRRARDEREKRTRRTPK